jgi:hypothetical protein
MNAESLGANHHYRGVCNLKKGRDISEPQGPESSRQSQKYTYGPE